MPIHFISVATWVGIRFDPGTIPYNPSDRTGSMLRYVVLNRAGSATFAAVNIDTQNPWLDHVVISNSAFTAISYSASTTSVQLNYVSIINVTGYAVNFPCSASACTRDYCFVRDSYFENSGSVYFCFDGYIFNNSRLVVERTQFVKSTSNAINVEKLHAASALHIVNCSFIDVQVCVKIPLPFVWHIQRSLCPKFSTSSNRVPE